LMNSTAQVSDEVLVVGEGSNVFKAILDLSKGGKSLHPLPLGSRLTLAGICSVSVDENHNPRSFRILLRSPTDVVVLERPSWFTFRHALVALAVMTMLILAAVYWVSALRRKVEEQMGILAERLARISALEERYRE